MISGVWGFAETFSEPFEGFVYFGELWWFITNLNYARTTHKIVESQSEPNLGRRKRDCSL